MGHDESEFYIHRALLSRLSAPLGDLVNDRTKASLEGCVTWEDVDEGVFLRFAQFAYTGTYMGFAPAEKDDPAGCSEGVPDNAVKVVEKPQDSIGPRQSPFPDPSKIVQPINITDTFKLPYSLASYKMTADRMHGLFCKYNGYKPSAACDCGAGGDGGPSTKKRKFVSAFMEKQSDLAEASDVDVWQNIWQTKQASPRESFEHVFIGHAGIWILADRYAISSLMDLACSYLVHELSQWTISASAFVPEFAISVRYVYSRTDPGCQLRLVVAQFAACVVEDVSGLEGWSALFNETPGFGADLVYQMTNRFD